MEFLRTVTAENILGMMACLAVLGSPVSYLLFRHVLESVAVDAKRRCHVSEIWYMGYDILNIARQREKDVVPRGHPAVQAVR